jgi:transcriptional antiterminator
MKLIPTTNNIKVNKRNTKFTYIFENLNVSWMEEYSFKFSYVPLREVDSATSCLDQFFSNLSMPGDL